MLQKILSLLLRCSLLETYLYFFCWREVSVALFSKNSHLLLSDRALELRGLHFSLGIQIDPFVTGKYLGQFHKEYSLFIFILSHQTCYLQLYYLDQILYYLFQEMSLIVLLLFLKQALFVQIQCLVAAELDGSEMHLSSADLALESDINNFIMNLYKLINAYVCYYFLG